MAYTLIVGLALGSSQTGLTLSAQLKDTAGSNVGSAVTSGFVELGVGNYSWTYAAFPDNFRGVVVFTASAVVKACAAINPEEADDAPIPDVASDADARLSKRKMIRALFNRFFDEVTQTATQQKVKNDAGTVISTMTVGDDGNAQTKAKSS